MVGEILLGIDLGTTVLKICAFDAKSGKLRGQANKKLSVRSLPGGGREIQLGSLDRAFREVVSVVREQCGKKFWNAVGIGLAAQGGSAIIADRKSGKVLTPMYLWTDARAQTDTDDLAGRCSTQTWRRFLLSDLPPMGLGRLQWLQNRHAALFHDENIHIGAGEYLYHRLTGVWRQDAGNAIQVGSYNAARKRLESRLFDLIGVPLSFVAPLREGHETAPLSRRGMKWLGFEHSVPVVGPYIDQEAGYLSTVGVTDKPMQCSLGTAWVGNFVLPDQTDGASPTQIAIPSPHGNGRLIIQPLLTGNDAWDWGLRTLFGENTPRLVERAAKVFERSLLPPRGLITIPWHTSSNPILPDRYGGGISVGMGTQSQPEDALRALAAGLAYEFVRVLENVTKSDAVSTVILGGGACQGSHFRRLLSALFAPVPVRWQTHPGFAVARGSVFAFDPGIACAGTRSVPPPKDALGDSIRTGYEDYLAVYRRFGASNLTAKAFQFGG